ncbi:MAG: SDR family NAD(P)-dependent oxidoreductase [Bacteroidetes bacterium]|nr:SDR family NAD(P)-dependent oxidoreductase [Bacteroidota bacterium]MDA1120490.1 SDR family NAD(P)-dependent oxidoreductase [Bacteroidota bacterium]
MLTGKNILIVGGTTGLGLSAALAFVKQEAKVLVTGRNHESCTRAQEQLGEHGFAMNSDATVEGSAEEAIEMCLKKWGVLHGLYHVAGGSGRKLGDGALHEMTLEGWHETLELNLTSSMLSNRAVIKTFLKQKQGGAILNMGSVLGFAPSPIYFGTIAYATAKSAIIGLSKSLASCYAKDNIRVNVIAPALVETPMAQRAAQDVNIQKFINTKQPLDGGRIGHPKDLDGAASLLLSDQGKFITGQVLTVDGGWSTSEGQYSAS